VDQTGSTIRRLLSRRAIATTIAVCAPLLLIVSTIRWSVDVPFLDEWDWADLAYHSRTGTLSFAEIIAPHNEHRNAIPNLVFLLFDRFGSWNILHEQLFSLAVIVVGQVILWRLVRRNIPGTRGALTFAAMSLVLCSLGQWENFALGYNIGWNICTTAAIAVVALLTAHRRSAKHLALAAALAGAATFSSGQGLLLWPVGLAAIALVPRDLPRSAVAWLVAGALVVVLFYTDYHVAPAVQPAGLRDALSCVLYAFTYIGTALRGGSGSTQATITGALLVGAFCVAAWTRASRFTRVQVVRHAPWYAFGFYAILGAAFTAVARVRMGPDSATASHYVAVALFLEIAIVGLVAASWPQLRRSSRRNWRIAFVAAAVFALGTEIHGIVSFQRYAADRHREIGELKSGGRDLTQLAYPYPARLTRLLDEMGAVHDVPFART
jgi:hypothetical protein